VCRRPRESIEYHRTWRFPGACSFLGGRRLHPAGAAMLRCRHGERKPRDARRVCAMACRADAGRSFGRGPGSLRWSCAAGPADRGWSGFEEAAVLICLSLALTCSVSQAGSSWKKSESTPDRIDEPAYCVSGGSCYELHGANISPEGAAIDVENPAFVPPSFKLVMAKTPRSTNAELSGSRKSDRRTFHCDAAAAASGQLNGRQRFQQRSDLLVCVPSIRASRRSGRCRKSSG